MRKITSFIVVLAMVFGMSCSAFAGNAAVLEYGYETNVNVAFKAASIDVTVPTLISFTSNGGGDAVIAGDYKIVNNMSLGALQLRGMFWNVTNKYECVNEAPTPWLANSRKIVLKINDQTVQTTCTTPFKSANFQNIDAESSLDLDIDLTTAVQTSKITKDIGKITFVIDFARDETVYGEVKGASGDYKDAGMMLYEQASAAGLLTDKMTSCQALFDNKGVGYQTTMAHLSQIYGANIRSYVFTSNVPASGACTYKLDLANVFYPKQTVRICLADTARINAYGVVQLDDNACVVIDTTAPICGIHLLPTNESATKF